MVKLKKGDPVWIVRPWSIEWWTLKSSKVSFIDDEGRVWVSRVPYDSCTLIASVGQEEAFRSRLVPRTRLIPEGAVRHDDVFFIAKNNVPTIKAA